MPQMGPQAIAAETYGALMAEKESKQQAQQQQRQFAMQQQQMAMEKERLEIQKQQAEDQARAGMMSGVGGIIGGVLGGIFGIFGGGGKGGGIGTVICTELHRQGLLSSNIYEADSQFGKSLPIDVLTGYSVIGIPIANAMQHSVIVTTIVSWIAVPWAKEIAYRMGVLSHGNILGKITNYIGIPVCRTIGRCIMTVSWGW